MADRGLSTLKDFIFCLDFGAHLTHSAEIGFCDLSHTFKTSVSRAGVKEVVTLKLSVTLHCPCTPVLGS